MEQVLLSVKAIKLLLKKHKHLLEAVLRKSGKRRPIRVKIRVEDQSQSGETAAKDNN